MRIYGKHVDQFQSAVTSNIISFKMYQNANEISMYYFLNDFVK